MPTNPQNSLTLMVVRGSIASRLALFIDMVDLRSVPDEGTSAIKGRLVAQLPDFPLGIFRRSSAYKLMDRSSTMAECRFLMFRLFMTISGKQEDQGDLPPSGASIPRASINVLEDMLAANLQIMDTKAGSSMLYDLRFKLMLRSVYRRCKEGDSVTTEQTNALFGNAPMGSALQKMEYLINGLTFGRLEKACESVDRDIGRVAEVVGSIVVFAKIVASSNVSSEYNGQSRERTLAYEYLLETQPNETESTLVKQYYKYANVFSIVMALKQHSVKLTDIWNAQIDEAKMRDVAASASIYQEVLHGFHSPLFGIEDNGKVGRRGRPIVGLLPSPRSKRIKLPEARRLEALRIAVDTFLEPKAADRSYFLKNYNRKTARSR